MPDRLTARVALMALLVLLTIAGTRAVSPTVGWRLPSRPVVLVVGGVLEAVLAGLLVALRWRRSAAAVSPDAVSPDAVPPDADLGTRLRGPLSAALVTGLVVIPIAMVVASLGRWKRQQQRPPALKITHLRRIKTPPVSAGHSPNLAGLIHYLLIAILIVALVAVAIAIWRHRLAWSRRPDDTDLDDAADTPAELARAVQSARQALRDVDEARAAIIECYVAMESSLADAGTERAAAETPDELLARAVRLGVVGAGPAGRLTALFYEARFSTHPMPPSRRDEAEQALADLAATLPDQRAATLSAGSAATASAAGNGSTGSRGSRQAGP